MVLDILHNCKFSSRQRPWGGMSRLECCPAGPQWEELCSLPGVQFFHGDRKTDSGWLVARNIIEAGRHPASVQGWHPCQPENAPSGLALKEHQRRAASFLFEAQLNDREGCILGAEVGTGKSIAALHALYLGALLAKPGIVCGPLASASVWIDEEGDANKHYGLKLYQLEGRDNIDLSLLQQHRQIFLNYDILQSWWPWLQVHIQPQWVIFDEIHMLMNSKAQRAEAARELSRTATLKVRYGLTGTPIPNRRKELWNQLVTVQPHQWGTDGGFRFGMRYCDGRAEGDEHFTRYVFDGESNDEELRARLSGVLLRYSKRNVSNTMATITRESVRIKPDPELLAEYHRARRNIVEYLVEEKGVSRAPKELLIGDSTVKVGKQSLTALQLQACTMLLGLLSAYKARFVPDLIHERIQAHSKILVFVNRLQTASELTKTVAERCGIHVFKITGQHKQPRREEIAKEFANHEGKAVCVATYKSVGISINGLKAASLGIFVDLMWNTATMLQAEGRYDRQNSPHKEIKSILTFVPNTIDERIAELLYEKAAAAQAVSPEDSEGMQIVAALTPDQPAKRDVVKNLLKSLESITEIED